MELLVSIAVRIALLVLAWKVWRWASTVGAKVRWRRRIALALFLLPLLVFAAEVVLPTEKEAVLAPLKAVDEKLDQLIAWLLGLTDEAPGLFGLALRPLVYAAVYGGIGLLIGWPLDRLSGKKPEEEEEEEEAKRG